MNKSEQSLEKLKNKIILLDTSVLIKLIDDQIVSDSFLKFIKKVGSFTTICAPVYTEFVNGAVKHNVGHGIVDNFCMREDFMRKIRVKPEPSINERIIVLARELATLINIAAADLKYKTDLKEKPVPSFADYLLGSLTIHADVILATINHKDFPLFLYDRIYLRTEENLSQISNIGFYKFSPGKYNSLVKDALKIMKKKKR